MPKLNTLKVKVVGNQLIHCSGCENAIRHCLFQAPWVKCVKADYRTQLVEVTYDVTQANKETIREWLDWIGYETVLI